MPAKVVKAVGTSEDLAFLLAHDRRAELIVAVGSHGNLREFLDKGRDGMSSTFLVRLRVGEILMDAKGVSRVYGGRTFRARDAVLLVGSAMFAMLVVVADLPAAPALLRPALRTDPPGPVRPQGAVLISWRYHLVSIVAVFLALGLGILVGTTVLDDSLVNSLRRRTEELQGLNSDLRDKLDAAEQTIAGLQAFATDVQPFLLA